MEELGQFPLDGVKVWAKIDCCYRRDGIRILDWKTGRSLAAESTIQIVCYCLYAQEKWRTSVESVRPAEYYLLVDRIQEYQVTAGDVADARAYVRGSVADMQSLLADATRNEPLAENAFERTDDLRSCRRCNFVRVCRPELLPALRGESAEEG